MPCAFSKIWIIVIVIAIIAGGIFAWQYFWVLKEEIKAPEEIEAPEISSRLEPREISIALFVDEYTYSQLTNEIDRYKQDILNK